MIRVSEEDRRVLRHPWKPLIRTKLREFSVKLRGERFTGQGLIGAEAGDVAKGFSDLSGEEFATYNYPQVWVERRQIPRAIDGKIPVKNAMVLDLGCGPGTSTDVLCYFADPSWNIVGFDLTQASIDRANNRAARLEFKNKKRQTIMPRFVCQDISLPLGDPEGGTLPSDSADLGISGGVVGLYMNRESVTRLARELHRVLKTGGYACLDSGPAVPRSELREVLESEGFTYVHSAGSVPLEPRPKLIFRKRSSRT